MSTIKEINDSSLKDFDLVKCFCKQCNKTSLFKVIFLPEGITGTCKRCDSYLMLKENKSYIPPQPSNSIPTVTCPYCQSTNTKKISTMSKAGSVALFGVFAMGKVSKQWHCNNCSSDF